MLRGVITVRENKNTPIKKLNISVKGERGSSSPKQSSRWSLLRKHSSSVQWVFCRAIYTFHFDTTDEVRVGKISFQLKISVSTKKTSEAWHQKLTYWASTHAKQWAGPVQFGWSWTPLRFFGGVRSRVKFSLTSSNTSRTQGRYLLSGKTKTLPSRSQVSEKWFIVAIN